ncbi:MAG TPA: hypothetical protein VG841_15550 [Caulobacterales bacterium]|nr:hypothetical protein [Caulobacterales bacterium]
MRVLLGALAALAAPQPAGADCLPFAQPAHVTGTLIERTYSGPPNYEDVTKGDQPETSFFVRLNSSVCVNADPELGGDPATVDIVQLVITDAASYRRYHSLLGQMVIADGEWMQAATGRDHTQRLIWEAKLSPAS